MATINVCIWFEDKGRAESPAWVLYVSQTLGRTPTALLVWNWQLCVAAGVSLTSALACFSVDPAAVIHLHMLPFASTPGEDLHSLPSCEDTKALCFPKGKQFIAQQQLERTVRFCFGAPCMYYKRNVIQSLFSNTYRLGLSNVTQ